MSDDSCPYSIIVAGVPVCMLNVLPCERVSRRLCEMVKPKQSGIAGEGGKSNVFESNNNK